MKKFDLEEARHRRDCIYMAYMFLTKGWGRIFAAGLVASLFIMGCGSDGTGPGGNSIVNGDAGIMGESKIQTWAELDDAGAVIRVGVTAGASGLDNLTGEDHLVLAFPDAVQSQTFFNHMGFDFSDHGHGPPPYLLPHFDLHFYGVDVASAGEVDCIDEPLPEGLEAGVPAMGLETVPDWYLIPSTALEPEGSCVPAMGVHALDVRSPELQDDPEMFTRTLIIGYQNAEITFIEPMVTQAHLAERSEWAWDVPRPTVLGRSVLWPATFKASFDADTDTYTLEYSGFSAIE